MSSGCFPQENYNYTFQMSGNAPLQEKCAQHGCESPLIEGRSLRLNLPSQKAVLLSPITIHSNVLMSFLTIYMW